MSNAMAKQGPGPGQERTLRKDLAAIRPQAAQMFAEYNKVSNAVWAEYDKVRNAALAEYDKVCCAAHAEYNKVRNEVFWKLFSDTKNRAETWK